jgi:hypothetical protein
MHHPEKQCGARRLMYHSVVVYLPNSSCGQLWQKQVTGVFISRVQRNYPGPRKNNTTYTAERMHKIRITQPNVTLLPWIKGYLKAASNTKRMNCREASPSLSSVDVVLEATKRWERINCLSFLFSPHTRIRILVNTLMAREQRIFHVEALRTRDHGTYWLIDWFFFYKFESQKHETYIQYNST